MEIRKKMHEDMIEAMRSKKDVERDVLRGVEGVIRNKDIELRRAGKEVSEDDVANALWTKGMPDPDVIVRTGGEKRLSGFLTWSSVYAELFFPDVYWPAFTKDDFDAILSEYRERDRRHGK